MANVKIPEAEFVLSCPHIGLGPKRPLPEIAFAGRSNVGKSSLINSLLNRRQLALTSRTPGKTRLLNYFLIGKGLCYFVDLPGYGYARVSGAMKDQWGEYIEEYLQNAPRLRRVVLILDIRHGLTPIDQVMVSGLHTLHRPWMAILTKADKLTTNQCHQAVQATAGLLTSLGAKVVLPYSSETHAGRDEVWSEIFAIAKE
jgi:GTP-binding protein